MRRPSSIRAAASICAATSSTAASGSGSTATWGIGRGDAPPGEHLARLDDHLCELKELQIRDGLHVFGRAPEGEQLHRPAGGAARAAARRGEGGDASLLRALAQDLGLDWDPLGADAGRCLDRAATGRAAGARHRSAGGPPATRSSGWSCWPDGWSPASWLPRRAGRRRPRCWHVSSGAAPGRRQLRRARSSPACCAGWTAGAWRPARAVRRPAAGSTCCRPAATSTRSTAAPCRRRRPGIWAGSRPS